MAMTTPTAAGREPTADPRWRVAGGFLDALSRRDFVALTDSMAPNVAFRALTPGGIREASDAAAATAYFQRWFATQQEFAVIDAEVGQVGSRLSLRWRLRTCAAEPGAVGCVIEQHAFTTVEDRITALDLICSGFHPECRP